MAHRRVLPAIKNKIGGKRPKRANRLARCSNQAQEIGIDHALGFFVYGLSSLDDWIITPPMSAEVTKVFMAPFRQLLCDRVLIGLRNRRWEFDFVIAVSKYHGLGPVH